jgi:hypothetical protein
MPLKFEGIRFLAARSGINCLRQLECLGLGFESPLEAWMSVSAFILFVLSCVCR